MSLFNSPKRIFRGWRSQRPQTRPRMRPRLEVLEDRLAPATDIVTNPNPSGPGSLSYEVANAEAGDTIVFQQGLKGTITPGGTSLAGAVEISKNLTIQGPGADVLTISGEGKARVFYVDTGVTASISGLTITGGMPSVPAATGTFGGGIVNGGNLTLTNVEVTDNSLNLSNANGFGAGIANFGTLSLTASTVDHNSINSIGANNSSNGEGGGIYNGAGGQLYMVNDTVDDNFFLGGKSGFGGGVYNAASPSEGPNGNVSMINVTIANNVDDLTSDGAGIFNGGSLVMFNSIVYDPNGFGSNPDVSGQITVGGGNLFGSNVQIETSSGQNQFNKNPLLSPLKDNGGSTLTMALSPNSPAFGTGLSVGVQSPTTDQRGFPRPSNIIDIGAYQYQAPATTTNLDVSSKSVQAGQPVTLKATVTFGAPNTNASLGTVTFYNGSTALKTVSLANGSASMETTLPVGNNNITAKYSGASAGAFVLDPSTSNAVTIAVSPSQTSSQPPSSSSPSPSSSSSPSPLRPPPPNPVGALSLFGLGFGPGDQLDIFEVDSAGQIFAASLIDLFFGQGGLVFVNSGVVLSDLRLQDQKVLGFLLGAYNQTYMTEIFSFSDPHVYSAAVNALLGEPTGTQPQPAGGSGGSGGGNVAANSPPHPNGPGFFSGTLTEPFFLDIALSDEDGHGADLTGNGTIIVTGNGNSQDGVNYSLSFKLDQDGPLHPKGYNFEQGIDYSGTFTATGHAPPQTANGNQVSGYFGGGANTLFLSGGSTSDHLIMVADPNWFIYVDSSGGGPNGSPSFAIGANLNQQDTGTGQPFGVTAYGLIEAGPLIPNTGG